MKLVRPKDIILTTLNARYSHAALGLRYLHANMGKLANRTLVKEFTIDQRPTDIVESLLQYDPKIVGFGVYIWNVEQTTKVIAQLKLIAPTVTIVAGGPEVSYELDEQEIVALCDHVITGMADLEFAALCDMLLQKAITPLKVTTAPNPELIKLALPYALYSPDDIKNRFIYVEASRGCPFKCEFCLSSLDKTAWMFDLDRFLTELDSLYQRGARHFRFVDRTFNLKVRNSVRILEFFLERLEDDRLFTHFEVIPDHLPEPLKVLLTRFPPGSLQLEIGIQTLDSEVQSLISRKQDNDKAMENMAWIRNHTNAHIHTDLIIGLPGEDLDRFAQGFNKLVSINPHEIQLGILKRLRGSPIIRHTKEYGMNYNPDPPYNVLSTKLIDFESMQRMNRFARYWDLIANSGRFKNTVPLALGADPFNRFLSLTDWVYATTHQTHRIALHRLFDLLYFGLTSELHVDKTLVIDKLSKDLDGTYTPPQNPPTDKKAPSQRARKREARQIRHSFL